jgi:hypothetical protein
LETPQIHSTLANLDNPIPRPLILSMLQAQLQQRQGITQKMIALSACSY